MSATGTRAESGSAGATFRSFSSVGLPLTGDGERDCGTCGDSISVCLGFIVAILA